ncbi:MAG: helix-turn-helix domain-containing protein [Novosphingobium sp.]
MTRSSPGVKRIAAILDFMADHPAQSFVLTDLVRALRLSRATCHALLTGLVEVGYLYRTSDKAYVLGPALAKVGKAVLHNLSPLQVAQPELRALADEFDVVCSAFFLEGDTIVSRERAASISHVGYSLPLGTRVKLMPRSVPVFFAWSPHEAEAWLARCDPPLDEAQRAAIMGGMAFAREHGFAALMRTDLSESENGGETGAAAFEVPGGISDHPIAILSAIEADRRYALSSLTAPVFNAAGKVEFVVGLMGFTRAMTGAEAFDAATALRAACGRIGAFLG